MNTKEFPILIIEDDPDMGQLLAQFAKRFNFIPTLSQNYEEGLQQIHSKKFDLILSDLNLPDGTGIDLLAEAKALNEEIHFTLITGYANVQQTIKAFKLGLNDMITKPFESSQIKSLFQRLYQMQSHAFRMLQLQQQLEQATAQSLPQYTPQGQNYTQIQSLINQVSPLDVPVLIQGETGVGKNTLAKQIHHTSPQKDGPFLEINCSALPDNLIESELFGYEKGAFTGANQQKIGLLELADKGTLLLDEVNSIPANIQLKLLHFLQQQSFIRVGGQKQIQVSVRLIFASNQDLKSLVNKGIIREDFFYRINIFPIQLPPLRALSEDIPPLAEHFLAFFNHKMHKSIKGFSTETLDILKKYNWPGNIRELENIIQRAVVLCQEDKIKPIHLPQELVTHTTPLCCSPFPEQASLEEVEAIWIKHILKSVEGNKIKAAQILGINPSTLHRKLKTID